MDKCAGGRHFSLRWHYCLDCVPDCTDRLKKTESKSDFVLVLLPTRVGHRTYNLTLFIEGRSCFLYT